MKGLIFQEFLEFVEKTMSYDMVDKIILKTRPESCGAYTTIGTYNPDELFLMVSALSEEINIPASQILLEYGEYLFGVFVQRYPQFFKHKKSAFEFLSQVESHVHTEVQKYYTDANLPHFETSPLPSDQFTMIYSSTRPLADLAEGLIRGCIKYHKENIDVQREDLPSKNKTKAKFVLSKRKL